MSKTSSLDQALIEAIKREIELVSGLNNKQKWTQKDYDFLVFFIEEQTDISLSVSTIKRIWRNEYQRTPHLSTLNALAQLAYKMDWLSLKKQSLEQQESATVEASKSKRKKVKTLPLKAIITLLVLLVLITGALFFMDRKQVVVGDQDLIEFSSKQSMDGKVPNTTVFSYNIASVKADSFFIQQSWDASRRVRIYKDDNKRTDIYYIPGYFTAQLLANTQVIKEIPVHITSEDWFLSIRQPQARVHAFYQQDWLRENHLGIDKSTLIDRGIDLNRTFQLGIHNVREFAASGDHFAYDSRFKMDRIDAIACPTLSLLIKGQNHYFWIMIGNEGCESELGLVCSEKQYSGKTKDLSSFGTNIHQWQELVVSVVRQHVEISLNSKVIFKDRYESPIGSLKEISYFFNGLGMIDDVELRDANGLEIFLDDFE